MIRVALYILLVGAIAFWAAWLADRPGDLVLDWQGWHVETSVMVAAVGIVAIVVVLMVAWTLVRWILHGPSAIGGFFRERRQTRGYKALSRGMVAAGAGDARLARHAAREAHKLLSDEPLTLLLDAQAAQLSGDRKGAAAAFESMAERPDTELLGLRGLYIEAQRSGDEATARACVERAAARAPGLAWAAGALLETQTREGDWQAALGTVERNAEHRLIDKQAAKRLRAVLLTAQALEREDKEPERALALALEAHKLAPELVPAAVVAARQSSAAGNTRQATRIVEKTWRLSPHPDLAEIYAHARPGDSARDRLKRARQLLDKMPNNVEGRIGVATAAIDARDWAEARAAIEPLAASRPTQRVCLLMADIAEGETGDAGKVREWLARAVRAPRDPAWTADGYVSETWAPVSPVSGRLDAFEWKVPVEALSAPVGEPEPEPAAEPAGEPVAGTAPMIEVQPAPIEEQAPEENGPIEPVDVTPVAEEPTEPEAAVPQPETAAAGADLAETPAAPREPEKKAEDRPAPSPARPSEEHAPETTAATASGDRSASESVAERLFEMDRAPDDPGPLPPDEDEEAPKKRFGLF